MMKAKERPQQMAQPLIEMTHFSPPHISHRACRYFGTDGIRGRVGVWPITPEFVLKLGWAVGKVLAR
jgi:phosphoglucosamine mutase